MDISLWFQDWFKIAPLTLLTMGVPPSILVSDQETRTDGPAGLIRSSQGVGVMASQSQSKSSVVSEDKVTRSTVKIITQGVTINLTMERDPDHNNDYFIKSIVGYFPGKDTSWIGHTFAKGQSDYMEWPSDWTKSERNEDLVVTFRDNLITFFQSIDPTMTVRKGRL